MTDERPAPGLPRAAGVVVLASLIGHVASQLLGSRALGAELLAAFAVDLLASRVGAGWYGDRPMRRDLARGAGLGAAATVVAMGAGLALGQARLVVGGVDVVSTALGALVAIAAAVRIELSYRWLPYVMGRGLADARWLLAFGAVAGAAPVALALPLRPLGIALALAQGALSVGLIRATGGLVASVAANATVRFLVTVVFGSMVEARWASGTLVPLDRASGTGALVLSMALALAALPVFRRR